MRGTYMVGGIETSSAYIAAALAGAVLGQGITARRCGREPLSQPAGAVVDRALEIESYLSMNSR